ncbi:MAG: CoA activase [Ignavibacteriae bacterium]|nr:CoA activase [Ignavibacteriota bacterium]
MKYFLGIDIGSTSIKIAMINENNELVATNTSPTGSRFHKNALDAMHGLLEKHNIKDEEIAYTISTGYGRKLFKESNESINEITANAQGAHGVGKELGNIKTIINVGGQDLKVIALDVHGNVKNFVMNDKCAAGTGRFLEVASRNLEVDIEEFSELHFQAEKAPQPLNSTCAVFAESEIISLLAAGHNKGELVAGIHYSIAKRIARLAARVGVEDDVLFDGGAALNRGLVTALEDELMRKIYVPKSPQTTTAIGAASIAKNIYTRNNLNNETENAQPTNAEIEKPIKYNFFNKLLGKEK